MTIFLPETWFTLKVVKQQSSEIENENFLPHNLPTKTQIDSNSFAHHYAQELRTPASQGAGDALFPAADPALPWPHCLWESLPLQLPGLRQLSHNIKEQKLNQVICQVIKTELEQSLRNT